jgi:hypothetical protein
MILSKFLALMRAIQTIFDYLKRLRVFGFVVKSCTEDRSALVVPCHLGRMSIAAEVSTRGIFLMVSGTGNFAVLLQRFLDIHRQMEGSHAQCLPFVFSLSGKPKLERQNLLVRVLTSLSG